MEELDNWQKLWINHARAREKQKPHTGNTTVSATQLKNGMRAWHEELLEFLLAHPRASLAETAIYFNASISWLSIVKNSDAFQELWAKRREEHFNRVSINVSERITALAEVTVDALTVKMEKAIQTDTATIDQLKEVGDMALKALGFGAKHSSSISIQQNSTTSNVFVDKATLERAREARRSIQNQESLEITAVEPALIDVYREKE